MTRFFVSLGMLALAGCASLPPDDGSNFYRPAPNPYAYQPAPAEVQQGGWVQAPNDSAGMAQAPVPQQASGDPTNTMTGPYAAPSDMAPGNPMSGGYPMADGYTRGSGGDYTLGTGDKVRVVVFREDDLSGVFEIDGSGYVRMPLIGQVQAAGLSVRDFEQEVAAMLNDGWVNDAKVSAEVISYRPFFIIGEVNKPGEYPYVNGMNVVTAVALAGGFTYRADKSDAYIRRNGSPEEIEAEANVTTMILPGDIIRISERFF